MEAGRRGTLLEWIDCAELSSSPRSVSVSIAGLGVEFLTSSAELYLQLRSYFHEYLVPLEPGCARIHLHCEASEDPELWEDVDPEFDIRGEKVVHRDFVAKRLAPGLAIARVAPALDDSIHNLLRWFLPPILLARGAFLLHGAGVIRDGLGYVFFGQSGAGKSTSSGLIAGYDGRANVLGDDSVIIQLDPMNGLPRLHSAPLGCGYTREAPPLANAPIAGMFRLSQDDDHSIEAMSTAEAVATLLASAMNVRADESLDERFALALGFATTEPGVRKLRFKLDPGFWDLVIQQSYILETFSESSKGEHHEHESGQATQA